jgi:hypothetical protein
MAAPAPILSARDLEVELARFHADKHRTLHTAFFGTGVRTEVTVRIHGEHQRFKVEPVDCELRLREVLSNAKDAQPLVLLVDFTDRLPLDVQGRLAQGSLRFISRERRLANLFGAKAVAPALLEGPLADALLREGRPFPTPVEGTTVDEQTAWRRQLERMVGLSSASDLSEELVVEHFAREPRRPEVVKECEAEPIFAQAVGAYLRRAVGPVAELSWQCWLQGAGIEVAALSFVLQPLLEHLQEDHVHAFLDVQLEKLREGLTPDDSALLSRWAALAAPLALRLGNSEALLERVLSEADRRLEKKPKLVKYLLDSRYLSGGFVASKQLLARALQTTLAGLDQDGRGSVRSDDVRVAIEAQQRLSRHRLAARAAHETTMERALMAVRLLAYLALRSDWHAALADRIPIELSYELADHYATEGGFLDFARRAVRSGAPDDELGAALSSVASAADALRDSLDARFAPALARWNRDRCPGRLMPIEHTLDALAVDFVQQGPERKLLVLVMDGMAWSTAVEILLDLRDVNWAPLRWEPKNTTSTRMPAPMIAALPTMTEVSRAALFAGRLMRAGESLDTTKDPERLAVHRGFVKAFGQGPRLLLRTGAEDNAGHLTKEARELVLSSDQVVALVVNAVDDMLSATPSFRGTYNRKTIKALGPVLDAAREGRRAVLLVADHGHVLSDRERNVVKVEGADSPRYRELSETGLASERELVLDATTAYCKRKGQRLAMLVREADRYKNVHNLGEHGGASMAEVIAPALLIAADDLCQSVAGGDDSGLETVAFPVPAWWNLELPKKAKLELEAARSTPPKQARSKVDERQLQIFEKPKQEEAPPRPRSNRPAVSPWAKRLAAAYAEETQSRRDELHKRVLPMLDLLLEHDGRISDEVLAGKLGEAARNIGGRVAIMGEFLNVDGYDVIRHNVAARQVELDEAMLRELFGDRP